MVYGGGGISPDIFIPIDTTYYSDYYRDLIRTSALTNYMLSYTDRNRSQLTRRYRSFDAFSREYEIDAAAMKALIARDIWDMNEYFMVINENDQAISKALEVLNDSRFYETLLGYRKPQ